MRTGIQRQEVPAGPPVAPHPRGAIPTAVMRPKTVGAAEIRRIGGFGSPLAKFQNPPKNVVQQAIDSKGLTFAAQIQSEDVRRALMPLKLPRPRTKPKVLERMEFYVENELKLITETNNNSIDLSSRYSRLNIFRQAFHMFTPVVKPYTAILDGIISEYESFIRLLETRMETPGKEKKEIAKKFEAEVELMQSHMLHQLQTGNDELAKRQTALDEREKAIDIEIEKTKQENERLLGDINRLHEQNLTFANNVVDYRFQNQKVERELKEAEQYERNYRKLHLEHQMLLESIASGVVTSPLPQNASSGVFITQQNSDLAQLAATPDENNGRGSGQLPSPS